MHLYSLLFITFMAVSTVVALLLLVRMWSLRKEPGAYSLMWAILCLAIWTSTYAFEISSQGMETKIFWLKAEYLGIPFIALAIFIFGLVYSGRGKWLTWNRFGLLLVVPAASLALALTNEYHGLIWLNISPPPDSAIGPLAVEHGLWFNIYAGYSYALLALTTFYFAQIAYKRRGVFRLQAILMLLGMLIPWVANAIYVLQLSPLPAYDWTPLAFMFTLVALEIGYTRYRLVDILPVAQSTIVNSMLDAVLVVDKHGQIVDANPACERVFGLVEAELIGSDVRVHFPEWNAWTEATKPRSETSREFRLPGDPEQRIFNLRVETTVSPRGIVTGYLVILNDATRTVNAQRQMRLLVTALEAAQNGVVITDRDGMVQWVNPAFTQLTGYERNDIIGHRPSLLKSGAQEGEFYKEMWQTILNGGVWRGELVNRRKDGSTYNEEMTITPLVRDDGTITNFIAIKQDVTERKQAEEQLRHAHQQALEANRLKTQLLANVSHDLRTPLGTIMGYAEMMLVEAFGAQNQQQKTATAEILNSANALLTFVNNLIGQAQIETGKIVLNNQPFEPAILVESVRSVVSYHANKKGLNLEIDIDPSLPETLSGDSYWLRQILLNLANNAIKFTESGSVKIRTFRQDETTWGIEVKDTGPGIPKEAQQIIFDVFRQQDNSTHKHSGSGLGLAIVKELATLMGGQIELESAPGQGSIFTVFLPVEPVKEPVTK